MVCLPTLARNGQAWSGKKLLWSRRLNSRCLGSRLLWEQIDMDQDYGEQAFRQQVLSLGSRILGISLFGCEQAVREHVQERTLLGRSYFYAVICTFFFRSFLSLLFVHYLSV